jgi:ABC-type multidrug transport system fused ATPase/permease subunit
MKAPRRANEREGSAGVKGTIRILRPHVGSQRSVLAIAVLTTIVLAAAELARPFPLSLVIDHLFAESTAPGPFDIGGKEILLLAGIAGLVLLIAGVEALAAYQMEIRFRRAGEAIAHSLRIAVYAHLQRLSLSFHEKRQHGDLVTRATGDVNTIGQLFADYLGALMSSALLLLGMLVVSFIIDPILALAAFSIAPVLAVFTFRFRRRVKAAARRQRTKEGEIASLASEALSAMREVKALGSERYERDRLERTSEERQAAGLEAARIESRFGGMADVLGAVGAALVLIVGVVRVASGAVSPGDLVIMVAYARRVHRPLRDLARQAGRIARAMARAERIAEILATDEVLQERPDAFEGPRVDGAVGLDSVSFSYTPGQPVLADLTLHVPAGQKLALLGPSGVGKSTVAALLARFYDPASGRVLIDERDVKECSLSWLRSQVGLVLQETVLFTGTVADNIAYGTDAGRREVIQAAKAAGAHSFIAELPNGYDTPLGTRGVALSGGQRQRMAIARTLLRDPPVLVLDEPTAALDPDSEADVIEGLRGLVEGRTTIIITHSPALAAWADRTLVLEGGRIVRDEAADAPRIVPPVGPQAPESPMPAPVDPALPQIARLLSPEDMEPVFHRALGENATEPEVILRYLRYKPGTNLVVQYTVRVDGEEHEATAMIASRDYLERRAAKPENLALAEMVDGRCPSPTPLYFDSEVRCLIQWYPLDLSLPALAEPPARLHSTLQDAGVPVVEDGDEPTPLAYKPRRRGVLRLGHHVVKCYARVDHFEAARAALHTSSDLRSLVVPRFEGAVPSLRVTAQTLLPGKPAGAPALVAPRAGRVLADLHTSSLDWQRLESLARMPPSRQRDAAAASARLVVAVAPSLEGPVGRLVRKIEELTPEVDQPVPSHGDFNARQLLLVGGELAVTDFDELCLAPAALDLATYVAYLVYGEASDLAGAERVLDELVAAYGERPTGMSWYLATMILRRAPRPFRYQEPDWVTRVERMVDAAEEALWW